MPDFATAATAFTSIYDENHWVDGSGPGSLPDQVKSYVAFLSDFIRSNEIKSVVDIGCGDWQFSRHMDWAGITYRGLDVVGSVIARNREQFASENITFEVLENVQDIPATDLTLCKDVLQHLPIKDIHDYLAIFRSRSKYALITNDVHADRETHKGAAGIPLDAEAACNSEILHGQARPIRLRHAPFYADAPTVLRFVVVAYGVRYVKDVNLLSR